MFVGFYYIYRSVYLYNILSLSGDGHPFHPFVSSSIHPSSSSRKKKMMEEEEEGGGRMVAAAVYLYIYNILGVCLSSLVF